MVSSVSSSTSYAQMQTQMKSKAVLSDDKKAQLEDILSKYDAKKITKDQTKTMMEEIKKAGFTAADGSKDVIEAAGFELPKPKDGQNGGMPPPPPPDGQQGGQMPGYLQDFISKQQSGSVSQSDIDSLVKSLQTNGIYQSGVLVDKTT